MRNLISFESLRSEVALFFTLSSEILLHLREGEEGEEEGGEERGREEEKKRGKSKRR